MLGVQHLGLFVASGILLNLTPGQDTAYIIGRTIAQGRRAGVLSALGISTGSIVHSLAAAFGLSAVLAASARAFLAIKLIGAVYLVFIGLQMLLHRRAAPEDATAACPPESGWRVYRDGIVTNLFNPKVALFFMAFLPQFIDPAAPSTVAAFLLLGGIFICTGTIWCVILAFAAAAATARVRGNASAATLVKRATGALFVGLGVRLAVSR